MSLAKKTKQNMYLDNEVEKRETKGKEKQRERNE